MKTLAFFNNKGGVGKTTLAYHLAWMLSDQGRRVLVVDLDPQANLTSMFLTEDRLVQVWDTDVDSGQSIMGALDPLIRGLGDVREPHAERINSRLYLVPGDLALSGFESELSEAWGNCLDRREPAFRQTSAFHRIASMAAARVQADIAIMDVGPNFGAINRAALISAAHVVVPLAPDLFSLQGLRNLGPTLRKWREEWADRKGRNPASDIPLPEGQIEPIGYVILQFGIRDSRPVKAYERWLNQIPDTYHHCVLDERGDARSLVSDPSCLGLVKHYRSLVPLAMEARKPIFHLKAADGAIGAHYEAVQHCANAFADLAAKISDSVGLPPIVAQLALVS
ncbi:MAG: ParA family protein [Verrucomicrobia bacterium]|nr:ParA family protein [Verrucomicrobiota bacterium]